MNWKKELDFFKSPNEPLYVTGIEELQDFISTEIIEKLITDIPDEYYTTDPVGHIDPILLKEYLRDKWLNN